jgi:(p)ppGpp synthase/HD superfamily hydrolase
MVQGKASAPLLFPATKGAVMAADPHWVPSPAFLKAFEAACLAHGQDARKINREPYIGHLMGVASLVIEHNGTQEQAIAALLHDIIEDSPMTFDQLEFEFGPVVRKIVEACTDATHAEKAEEKEGNSTKTKQSQRAIAKLTRRSGGAAKVAYLARLKRKTTAILPFSSPSQTRSTMVKNRQWIFAEKAPKRLKDSEQVSILVLNFNASGIRA